MSFIAIEVSDFTSSFPHCYQSLRSGLQTFTLHEPVQYRKSVYFLITVPCFVGLRPLVPASHYQDYWYLLNRYLIIGDLGEVCSQLAVFLGNFAKVYIGALSLRVLVLLLGESSVPVFFGYKAGIPNYRPYW